MPRLPRLNAVRMLVTALLMISVGSTVLAGGASTTAAAAVSHGLTAGWSQGSRIDPLLGELTSISCPTPTFCIAVDATGNVLTYAAGEWSAPLSIDSGGFLTSVSCATASSCEAVDTAGNVFSYDGTWSSPDSIDPGNELVSISCVPGVTGSFCIAADSPGNVFSLTAGSWSKADAIDPTNGLQAVSCATPSFCVAADGYGYVLSFNGSSWSSTPDGIDTSVGDLQSISCPTEASVLPSTARGTSSAITEPHGHRHRSIPQRTMTRCRSRAPRQACASLWMGAVLGSPTTARRGRHLTPSMPSTRCTRCPVSHRHPRVCVPRWTPSAMSLPTTARRGPRHRASTRPKAG